MAQEKVNPGKACAHAGIGGSRGGKSRTTMPAEEIDPPPPKGTAERKRYDQQMREAYHQLMQPAPDS